MLVELSFGRHFEGDRGKMLRYGPSTGVTMEELFKITDPDRFLDCGRRQ
jgi:hypothetical protein